MCGSWQGIMLWPQLVQSWSTLCDSSLSVDHNSMAEVTLKGFRKCCYVLCNGMTMKKMVMFAVNVRKIKALTVMEQWHWLVKADRIWHALYILYEINSRIFFFADVAFWESSLYRGCFAFQYIWYFSQLLHPIYSYDLHLISSSQQSHQLWELGKMKSIVFISYCTRSESLNYKKTIVMTVKECADKVFCYCEHSESHCFS
jgi:hypothetical protein